jgi:ubiquinone/menaquinone biosynthesis C-methylase UbiE
MAELFDNFYNGYDAWYDTPMGKFVDEVETDCLYSLFKPQGGQKILDVCCGTANFSVKFAKAGCNVTGIDISEKMLEIANEKIKREKLNVELIKEDCSTVSLRENYYDAIISMAGFEFIPTPISAYKNLLRFLKPNGYFIIGTIQKGSEWQKLYSSLKGTVYEYANFLTSDDLKNMDMTSFCDQQECLFIPPALNETEYNKTNEIKFKTQNVTGGFICVKFKKNK